MRIAIAASFIVLNVLCLIFSVSPTPGEHYEGFVGGMILGSLHGSVWILNWIQSWSDPTHLVQASASSTVYTISWWVGAFQTTIYLPIMFAIGDSDSSSGESDWDNDLH